MLRSLPLLAAAALLATALDAPVPLLAQDTPAPREALRAGRGDSDLPAKANSLYIVQMAEDPVATYVGGAPGIAATRPGRGQRINSSAVNTVSYAAFLTTRHTQANDGVGGRKVHDYTYAFNGFSAELTEAQATALRSTAGVLAVTKDELRTADTSSTPTFLGLDAPDGLWNQFGTVDRAGEDVVIGVIDSGIWPESLSFSDRVPGAPKGWHAYAPLPDWNGKCARGEAFKKVDCNRKLIAAQWFNDAWGGDSGLKADRPWEFASARDYNGHGTHTASTAGGNTRVPTNGSAAVFGAISGMAPRARIAAYKALWSTQDGATASGFTSDLVAAIDQAVADGVDVINYSVSGTRTNFLDPVEISFLFAAEAGVFVSASAGNEGPVAGTVAHPSPWVTTVAAGTHNRSGEGSATFGSGITLSGSSLATATPMLPFIDSTAAGVAGADPAALALCYSKSFNGGTPALDPAKVAGKIVLCDRGVNARVDKSLAVKEAGGAGMVLVNVSPSSLNADFHFVPSVHLADTARAGLKAYASGANPTAKINLATVVYNVPAPLTAAFSSRGPLVAGGGDVLKPDLIAPGQDILAAVAPPANAGMSFNLYSGTSMSAPHVAGLAALLRDLHPNWSPMMIKSALMTTGTDVLDAGTPAPNTNPALIFRQGAGHVAPTQAADAGLVYDSEFEDWLAFLCGTTNGVNPAVCNSLKSQGYSLDPSDLNMASIAIGDLSGSQTVTRTVTNVGSRRSTYTATVTGLAGMTVAVNPSSLRIAPGHSKSFTVTFTRTTAAIGAYAGGQLTWSDSTHTVRSPIVVLPKALATPVEVSSTGGPINYNVKFGYSGAFTATPRGLIPATTAPGSVADDPLDAFDPAGPGVVSFPITIEPGTTYARFSLFDANVAPASDLDLYVYRGATLVAGSGNGTSTEEANILAPTPGSYTVYVHGFNVPGTANFTLFSWLLGSDPAGNMAVTAPAAAVNGTTGSIGLTFSGLAPGTKYLGSVVYGGTASLPNPTLVRVDP